MSEAGRQQDHALDAMLAGMLVVVWTRSRQRQRETERALVDRAEARGLAFTSRPALAELRAARGRGRVVVLVRGADFLDLGRPDLLFNDEWQRIR